MSRNPSIQIRAVPSCASAPVAVSPSFQVAIPPYRSGQFRAVHRHLSPSPLLFKSQSLHTDQGSSEVSGETLSGSGTTDSVAIPPYRSGQFRVRLLLDIVPYDKKVAIPPYRSGQFR